MPVDTTEIMDSATKLGHMVAQHPLVSRYKDAQKSVADDPDATRLMNEFNRQLDNLTRQEQAGMPMTDAQRMQVEGLQMQIASHIKIKAMHMAQTDFIDLLRKVNQTVQRQLSDNPGAAAGIQAGPPSHVVL